MATIATVDMKNIHDLYQEVKKEYSGYSERYLYFLATCFYLDPDLDLHIALKLRPMVVSLVLIILLLTNISNHTKF